MPPPVFDETHSVIQRPPSHWPRIGRWAVTIGSAVFPWPFLIAALFRLPFSKADDPKVSGLWGDMRWIVGVQIFALVVLVDGTISGSEGTRIAYGVALLVAIGSTIAMFRRHRYFPMLYGFQWIVVVTAAVLDYVLISPVTDGESIENLEFELNAILLASAVASIGGLWFLLTSRQSKNTFVR
jgi:hypothetical protein